jgi:hypothetical protein
MLNVIFVAGLALVLSFPATAEEKSAGKAEVKEVCHDKMKDGKPVKDKEGKNVQECKKIKVHKKLEGTEIPPAKK